MNPIEQILRQADTLKLTAPQADSVATVNRWYKIRLDSIWSPVAKVLGNLPADFVAVNKDYADEHPEALKAFWRVVAKTFGWAQTDPDAASEALAELIPIDAKYIKSSLVQYKDAFNVKVNPEVLKYLSDLMVTTKVVDAPIDWSTALDQQYLPEEDQATIGG
jgi:NitT/TauT family transport system substrate-binding protein